MGHKFHMVEDTAMGWLAADFGIYLPFCPLCSKMLSLDVIRSNVSVKIIHNEPQAI
jgi:hypothetical protein